MIFSRRAPYPIVIGELETLQLVVSGKSLARYGDGELKMAGHNAGIKSQIADLALSERLQQILVDSGDCLVGIPNIRRVIDEHVSDQKVAHWSNYLTYASRLSPRQYYSAFVTRPDSAPGIDTPEYWALLESLWKGLSVTLVRGSGKSFTAERLMAAGASEVREIIAPPQHAWAQYDSLLERIGTPERALLCLGPTATVMAVDLCAKGVHAIDLGHMGLFYKKHVNGDPMWLSKDDKAQEVFA